MLAKPSQAAVGAPANTSQCQETSELPGPALNPPDGGWLSVNPKGIPPKKGCLEEEKDPPEGWASGNPG